MKRGAELKKNNSLRHAQHSVELQTANKRKDGRGGELPRPPTLGGVQHWRLAGRLGGVPAGHGPAASLLASRAAAASGGGGHGGGVVVVVRGSGPLLAALPQTMQLLPASPVGLDQVQHGLQLRVQLHQRLHTRWRVRVVRATSWRVRL